MSVGPSHRSELRGIDLACWCQSRVDNDGAVPLVIHRDALERHGPADPGDGEPCICVDPVTDPCPGCRAHDST